MTRKYHEYVQQFNALGFSFRWNELTDCVECNGEIINKPLEATIKSRMADRDFTRREQVEEAWIRIAGENKYHPIKDYFESLSWNGQDHFGQLMACMEFKERAIAQKFWWRFLTGSQAKVFEQGQNFMLILDGVQGIGKSYLVSWLASPLKKYFVEGALSPDHKDTQIRVTNNFMWEVAEFQATIRKADQEALKHIITQRVMTVRRPYGKYDIEKPIIANFIGTMNENGGGFLTDTTGSRRFATVNIQAINHDYSTKIDINQLWAQIYSAYKAGENGILDHDESMEQSRINRGYEVGSPAVEMLYQHYRIDPIKHCDSWIPISEIIINLEERGLKGAQKFLMMEISAELVRVGCERSKLNTVTGNGRLTCYNGIKENVFSRVP